MCGLHAYNKENNNSTDETDFGGGRPLPDDSTTGSLVFLCVSINIIDNLISVLLNNFVWRCCTYQKKRK